jgi:hypothetical protein
MRTALASAMYVALQAIGSYAFAVLSVQWLTRGELSSWAVWEGWMLMLLPFATGGQEYNLIRKFASTEASVSGVVNGLLCLGALGLTMAFIIAMRPADGWLIALLLSSEVAMAIALTILRGQERYWHMVWLVGSRWAFAFICLLLLREWHPVHASSLVTARFLPVLPVMLFLLWALVDGLRRETVRLPRAAFWQECQYAFPLIAVALLNGGILGLPRILLEREGAIRSLTDLFVAQKVAMVYDLLFSRPLAIMWPQLRFKIHEKRTTMRVGWAYAWTLLICGCTMPVFLVLARFVFLPVFGVGAMDAHLVMLLLLCNAAIILLNTATMLSNISLYSTGKTRLMLYAGLVSMIGGGVVALLFMGHWSVIGINCLMVAVNTVNFILITVFSTRHHRWQASSKETRIAFIGILIIITCALVVGGWS